MGDQGDAKWREIVHDITARIASGEWPIGHRLPSYAQLAAQHETSVTTAQRAVRSLRDAGVLRGRPGVAVEVAALPSGPVGRPLTTEERLARLERAVFGPDGPPNA